MCGSSARTDLYGGQLAIAVPTVTGRKPGDRHLVLPIMPGDGLGLLCWGACNRMATQFERTAPQCVGREIQVLLSNFHSARPKQGYQRGTCFVGRFRTDEITPHHQKRPEFRGAISSRIVPNRPNPNRQISVISRTLSSYHRKARNLAPWGSRYCGRFHAGCVEVWRSHLRARPSSLAAIADKI